MSSPPPLAIVPPPLGSVPPSPPLSLASSPVSGASPPACPKLTIDHPKNDAATCWWLAANFAIFHKDRPEMNTFISGSNEIAQQYSTISSYYKGEGGDKQTIIDARLNSTLVAHFSTAGFVLNKSGYEDVTEYTMKLNESLKIPTPDEGRFIQNPTSFNLYDIYLHKSSFTIPETSKTLLLSFPRAKQGSTEPLDIPMKVLETIQVPVSTLITPYTLDGIVAAQTGHYYSVVKCEGSDQWVEHGLKNISTATDARDIDGTFVYENFSTMIGDKVNGTYTRDIEKQATLLFYTRS